MTHRHYCAIAIVTLIAVSCAEGDAVHEPFPVVDSAGVEIVAHWRSHATDRLAGFTLATTPSIQIGSLDQEITNLHRITDVARMANGGIAVANSGSGEVKVFDARGRFLYALGGAGGGPGEFGRLSRIGIRPNGNLLAYDSDAGRISEFDVTNKVVIATTTLTVDKDAYELAGLRRPRAVGWFRDGRFAAYYNVLEGRIVPTTGSGWIKHEWMSHVHFFDDGRASETLLTMLGSQRWTMGSNLGSGSIRVEGIDNPFLPTFVADTDGESMAYGSTRSFNIGLIDGRTGGVMRIVRRADGPRLASTADRDAWVSAKLAEFEEDGTERVRRRRTLYESSPFPDTLPAFETLLLQRGGRLWVKESSFGNPASSTRWWSVFDRRGNPLGVVETPTDLQLFEIGRDYVLGVWKDDLGVEYVQLFELIVRSD